MNKVMLIGFLGSDPELKYTSAKLAVATLRVATNESYKNKAGELVQKTDWHRVVVWGTQAENCSKHLAKGRQVHVEGRLQTRSWEKEGQKQYTTEVVAQRVTFLGGGAKKEDASAPADAGEGIEGGNDEAGVPL